MKPIEYFIAADKSDLIQYLIKNHKCTSGNYCFMMNGHNTKNNVMLVSHIDTIGKPPTTLYRRKNLLTSGKDEYLGADDRAGVYACIVLGEKHNIPVLFCDHEERGGLGAHESTIVYEKEINQALFLIEFDRRGDRDAVYYNNEPQHFRRFIKGYGFKEDLGSFTDISIIGKRLDICGVNLSIGFHHEHTTNEYLDLSILHRTIRRTNALIKATKKNPRRYRLPTNYNWNTDYYLQPKRKRKKKNRRRQDTPQFTNANDKAIPDDELDALVDYELTRYAANGDTPPMNEQEYEQFRQDIKDYYGI